MDLIKINENTKGRKGELVMGVNECDQSIRRIIKELTRNFDLRKKKKKGKRGKGKERHLRVFGLVLLLFGLK